MNLRGVIVSARLGGLFEALHQFTLFSREVRSLRCIALWRQYSKLITTLLSKTLAPVGTKLRNIFKGSVSSSNVHKELGTRSRAWLPCPHFCQNRSRFPGQWSVAPRTQSRFGLLLDNRAMLSSYSAVSLTIVFGGRSRLPDPAVSRHDRAPCGVEDDPTGSRV
jgi:hypothetical protein